MANPNRVRALIGSFAQVNHTQFNRIDGAGYDFVADTRAGARREEPAGRRAPDGRIPLLARARGDRRAAPKRHCAASPRRPRSRATSTTSWRARWRIARAASHGAGDRAACQSPVQPAAPGLRGRAAEGRRPACLRAARPGTARGGRRRPAGQRQRRVCRRHPGHGDRGGRRGRIQLVPRQAPVRRARRGDGRDRCRRRYRCRCRCRHRRGLPRRHALRGRCQRWQGGHGCLRRERDPGRVRHGNLGRLADRRDPHRAGARGERTAAGLPTRVPGANLFPGTPSGAEAWDTTEMPVPGARRPGYDAPQPRHERTAPQHRRSPEMARSRLSGFQLGSRQAEGLTSSAEEGS